LNINLDRFTLVDMPIGSTSADKLRRPGRNLLDWFRQRLQAGQWPAGTRLPPTRRLAADHGVSRATVQAVLALLTQEGWLRRDGRSGIYVQDPVQPAGRETGGSRRPEAMRRRQLPRRDDPGLLDFKLEARPISADGPRWSDEVLAGAHEELASRHLNAAIFSPMRLGDDAQRQFMERLAQAADHVVGVLALQPFLVDSTRRQIEALGLPCVVVHRRSPDDLHNFVAADHWGGGQTIGRLLAQSGAQRLIYLGGHGPQADQCLRFCSDRELVEGLLSGYAQARGAMPQSFEILACEGTSQEHGRATMARRLAQGEPPHAVVAAGDFLAIGAIRACRDADLRVPDDVGVIGSTGLWVAQQPPITLSTMAQPMRRIGAVGARMLLHLARTGKRCVSGRVLPCTIELRQSWQVDPQLLTREAQRLPARVRVDRLSSADECST
jgi:LacI family transcriptional regulator